MQRITVEVEARAAISEILAWRDMRAHDVIEFERRVSGGHVLITAIKAGLVIRRQEAEIKRLKERLGKYERKLPDNWPGEWSE